MIATLAGAPRTHSQQADKASTLALRLAYAEHALLALTSGQVDAIVDPSGKTYLLRPAQEHLRESEQRLRTLLESAPDVITVVNRGGMIVSQAGAVGQVLGYQPEELAGSDFFEMIHEEDVPAVHAAFFYVIEGLREHATVQFRHRSSDDTWRLIEATIAKLNGATPSSAVFNLRAATTAHVKRSEPLHDESAPVPPPLARDRFAAMLSHELRTPLMPAMLGLDELEDDERFVEARPVLAMIRRNLQLQTALLEQLGDFASVGQQKVRPRLEAIDAYEALRLVLEICHAEIAAARIEVLLDLRAAHHVVLADSARFQQVMWNLIKNAVKFSTPGSSISIGSANRAPGTLTLHFVDHGVGIEAQLLPRIFEPFQQGDKSLQQVCGGLGLGMFIAKGLTEAQGGTLTVSSKGRGRGAAFHLTLKTAQPASVPDVMVPGATFTGETSADKRHILLADEAGASEIASLLNECGHAVFPAPDIPTAVALAETCRFDVVISDILLPDPAGSFLMERLQITQPSLPGIAIADGGSPSDIDQSWQAGFSEHLVRPVRLRMLQWAMERAFAPTKPRGVACPA